MTGTSRNKDATKGKAGGRVALVDQMASVPVFLGRDAQGQQQSTIPIFTVVTHCMVTRVSNPSESIATFVPSVSSLTTITDTTYSHCGESHLPSNYTLRRLNHCS